MKEGCGRPETVAAAKNHIAGDEYLLSHLK